MIKVEQSSTCIELNQANKFVEIDTATIGMKIENIDILSEYFYLSPFSVNQEDKEVEHAISDETT